MADFCNPKAVGTALAAIKVSLINKYFQHKFTYEVSIMTLMRYSKPNRNTLDKNFSDIMDEFFNDVVNDKRGSFVPSIDISETEDQFQITAQLPGMSKDDIDISLENGRLAISGERSFENEEKGKKYHRVESKYGSFERSFQLPDNVDAESISATYENGLLNISIDKSEDKVKKQIEIS